MNMSKQVIQTRGWPLKILTNPSKCGTNPSNVDCYLKHTHENKLWGNSPWDEDNRGWKKPSKGRLSLQVWSTTLSKWDVSTQKAPKPAKWPPKGAWTCIQNDFYRMSVLLNLGGPLFIYHLRVKQSTNHPVLFV